VDDHWRDLAVLNLHIQAIEAATPLRAPIEVVERKGRGHPDSICDALAEEVSLALSRIYRQTFGTILHHNVDKVLLRGGVTRPRFGGGEVLEPIEIYVAGRAVSTFEGVTIPVEDITIDTCRAWWRRNLPAVDPVLQARVHCLIRPGSMDLTELFMRASTGQAPLANDTSCGVGFAPLSETEAVVFAADALLHNESAAGRPSGLGQDTKVMATRQNRSLHLTIACAQIDHEVHGLDEYQANKTWIRNAVAAATSCGDLPVSVDVNTADDEVAGSVFLTVTGTSAEAGDDGEAGRGNRVNGLITPYRPMTMECAFGKNPVTHVGKLYNIAASLIAEDLVTCYPELESAECFLVSQVGQPIDRPQLINVRLTLRTLATAPSRSEVERTITRHLAGLRTLADDQLAGTLVIGRWPLRSS
jgi:S-adenosylmethionine synthetase